MIPAKLCERNMFLAEVNIKTEDDHAADISFRSEPFEEDEAESDTSINFEPILLPKFETDEKEKEPEEESEPATGLNKAATEKLPEHSTGYYVPELYPFACSSGDQNKYTLMLSVTSSPKSLDKVLIYSDLNPASGEYDCKQNSRMKNSGLSDTLHSESRNLENCRYRQISTTLQTDRKVCRRRQNFNEISSNQRNQIETENSRDKLLACEHCDYNADSKKAHIKHLLTHQNKESKQFGCGHCNYRTCTKSNFQKHLRIHQPVRKNNFSCDLCNFRSDCRSDLQRHAITHQENRNKPFACDHCHYRADSKQNIESHVVTHLEDRNKPFACDHCHYQSDRMSSLRRHVLIHQTKRDKPFVCCHCTYKTDVKSNLAHHVLIHQTNRRKRLGCDWCEYRTDHLGNLRKHLTACSKRATHLIGSNLRDEERSATPPMSLS